MNPFAWLWRKLFPPQPAPTIEEIEGVPILGDILRLGEAAAGDYHPAPENASPLCTGEHK